MRRLQLLAALTEAHHAMQETVLDLEQTWGEPATVARMARLHGMEQANTRRLLEDLHAAGLIDFDALADSATCVPGIVIAGRVE